MAANGIKQEVQVTSPSGSAIKIKQIITIELGHLFLGLFLHYTFTMESLKFVRGNFRGLLVFCFLGECYFMDALAF